MKLENKKILVTGADGFIGSHLVEYLVVNGFKVKAFVYYNSFNSLGWLDTFDKKILDDIEIFSGDIRDPNGVFESAKDVDVIFHLAALIGIPFSYHSPDSYVDTNIKGTLNILQASKKYDLEKLLITSTSEVYGTAKYTPIDEKHPFQGQSPYSASKIGADRLSESFFKSFNTPLVIVRPFNTYGPRQSMRAIIPTIITQLLHGSKKIKLGNLDSVRDFNYVKDTVDGFIKIAESDKVLGEEINISSGESISMRKIAKILINKINPESTIALDKKRLRPVKSEVDELLGDNRKLLNLTSWKQNYNLLDGLEETIKWFSLNSNLKNYKPSAYNI